MKRKKVKISSDHGMVSIDEALLLEYDPRTAVSFRPIFSSLFSFKKIFAAVIY